MVIMNQWKDCIYPISNILKIDIEEIGEGYIRAKSTKALEEDIGKFSIVINYTTKSENIIHCEELGIYNTKKIAQKVLKEIMNDYYKKSNYCMPNNDVFIGASCPFAD